jgi:GNAT superfamily N-acetyltransferase
LNPVEVIPATGLTEPLALLEESLRGSEPVPEDLAERMRRAVDAGDMEVLAARTEDRILGVAILAYRPNIAAGALFASIEDLYVSPEARRQGIGQSLLTAADERCTQHDISYVEVQIQGDEAEAFYAALGYEPEKSVRVLSRSLPISDKRTDRKPKP